MSFSDNVYPTYSKDDEDGDHMEVAEIDIVQDYPIDEVRDEETGHDAENGKSGDPEWLGLQPDEAENEAEAADG